MTFLLTPTNHKENTDMEVALWKPPGCFNELSGYETGGFPEICAHTKDRSGNVPEKNLRISQFLRVRFSGKKQK